MSSMDMDVRRTYPVRQKRVNLHRWEEPLRHFLERMVEHVVDKQEAELQLVIVRGLLYVILPLCIILGSIEYIYKGNVNPFLLSIGSGISGAIVTLIKTGRRPAPDEPEPEEIRGGGLKVKRPAP